MLPAKNRLRFSVHDAKRNFAGKKVSSGEFILIYRRGPGIFKAAIVVSKKTAAKAVSRNRIKRLISEALMTRKGIDGEIVVIVKKNIAMYKKEQVSERLDALLRKFEQSK